MSIVPTMETNQKYAWVLFALACVCAIAASAYAVLGKKSDPSKLTPADDSGMDDTGEEPGYVPVMPVAPTMAPNQPATVTSNAPTAVPTVPVAVTYTAPGGWVWNPMYTHGVYWDMRYDPHWGAYDWRWPAKRDSWRHWRHRDHHYYKQAA